MARSKYNDLITPNLELIKEKVNQGVTQKAIAKALGITEQTLINYKDTHPELNEALKPNGVRGAERLQELVNSGVRAAIGYFEENETTVIVLGEDKKPKRQKTIQKIWYPPNPTLNKYYTMNFGKKFGFTNDPLLLELNKIKAGYESEIERLKNGHGEDDKELETQIKQLTAESIKSILDKVKEKRKPIEIESKTEEEREEE